VLIQREGHVERDRIDLFRAIVAAIRHAGAVHPRVGIGLRAASLYAVSLRAIGLLRPSGLPLRRRLQAVMLQGVVLRRVTVGPCRRAIAGTGPTGVVTLLVVGGLA